MVQRYKKELKSCKVVGKKKSRRGVLRDSECDFVASAQGIVDAVVEEMEEDVALLQASWDDVKPYEYAAITLAIDAIAVDDADIWGFHEDGHFAAVLLALAEGDVVGSCRYSVLTVFCCVADVVSVDGECAVASYFIYLAAMKMNL